MTLLGTDRIGARSGGCKAGALQDWVRALTATSAIAGEPYRTLPLLIEGVAQSRPDSLALASAEECFTYGALTERANRYARWALAQKLDKGDVVCLLMPNRPEYLAIWLGITGVGAVVSLLNINLRGASLAHCINIVGPKHIIVDSGLVPHLDSAIAHFTGTPVIWRHGGGADAIEHAIQAMSGDKLTLGERRNTSIFDRALCIYTSGTTGLPKAANVSHRRALQWSLWFAGLMNTGPDDRMYDCLPLYHSVGGIVATGSLLVRGGSVVIREKFSATEFWDDIRNWDCTLFQYIGELCRYLLRGSAPRPERPHRLRLCCGNGLRGDVWEKFQHKFAIPRILEFYAATEGNVSLYNVEGKVGAIGRVPPFLRHRFPLALLPIDPLTGEPVRDASGLCMPCPTGEVGEAVGKIHGAGETPRHEAQFEGYTDPQASRRKILTNVFEPGDAWYRTGDLMRCDPSGYFYFVDRTGDTFRWKGENVAASDVATALTEFAGISEATVYGVPVPGVEGAAGMAAIVADDTLDLAALRTHLARLLPPYARPLFLRIKHRIETTETFKQKTADLRREGFDPLAIADALYFDDPLQQAYVRLDPALYQRIRSGELRL